MSLTGGCLCSGVRYELTEPPVSASYCHCTRCQRRSGTAASAQVRVPPGSVRFVAGEELVKWFAPSGRIPQGVLLGVRLGALQPAAERRRADGRPAGFVRRRPGHPAAVAAVRGVRGGVGAHP